MKKLLLIICFLGYVSTLVAQDDKERIIKRTKVVLDALMREEYELIADYYEPSFASNNTGESLRQTVNDLNKQYGKLLRAGEPVIENIGINRICRTPLFFERGKQSLTLNFASNYCLTGLFITSANGIYETPDYVISLSFREELITFGTEGWKLPGVLTYPNDNKAHPVVIIIHDSGPLDRDGLKGVNRIYRDLAWGLASKGFCVFRYDKRSNVHGSKLFLQNYQGATYTSKDETVDDAIAAFELLKQNERVDTSRMFLLGHGQGGMLAPLIAASTPGLKGVILLGANARSIQDVLISQMDYLYPNTSEMKLKDFNEKKRVQAQARYAKRKNLPLNTPQDSLPFGVRADYWNYLNNYQPVAAFEQMSCPALVLQADRDFQTTQADYQLWQQTIAKRKNGTYLKSYPTLNHLFIKGSGPSKPAEYQIPGHFDDTVLTDIVKWISELP